MPNHALSNENAYVGSRSSSLDDLSRFVGVAAIIGVHLEQQQRLR